MILIGVWIRWIISFLVILFYYALLCICLLTNTKQRAIFIYMAGNKQNDNGETKMTNTIKTTITESTTHNFKQYDGQCQPQSAYIYVDTRTGGISSDYDGDFGNGVSRDIHEGKIQRFSIPCWLTCRSINDLMESVQSDIEEFLNKKHDKDDDCDEENHDYWSLEVMISDASFGLEQLEQNDDGEYIDEDGNCLE